MKRITLLKTLTIALFLLMGVRNAWGQTTIWSEDFSTGTQYSVTLGGEGSDGTADYFTRTDGTNINKVYSGFSGVFFAGQDIDDGGWTGSAVPSELTWSGINISGYTGLEFDGKFASVATEKIDADDYLHVQYRIDAGAWINLLWFENDGTTYNKAFYEDADFSGDGEGTQLTSTFANFNKSISTTGNNLDLKITVFVDSGDEDFAIDDFVISGIASGATPAPTALTIAQTTSDKMQITWTKPSGTHATDWDGVLVFLTDGAGGVALSASGEDGADYIASTIYGSGTEVTDEGLSQTGFCIANQTTDANGNITVTGLTDGNTYYVYAYAYKEVTGDNNDDEWSSEVDGGSDVAEVPEISGITITPGDQQLDLSWTNPSGAVTTWWDKVVIVAREGSAVEAAISKANFDGLVDGTVIAESDWSAAPGHENSDVYDQTAAGTDNTNYIVYNNTGGTKGSVTISGLADATTYHFKAMVYYEDGTLADVWSTGETGSGTTNAGIISLPYLEDFTGQNGKGATGTSSGTVYNLDGVSWTIDVGTTLETDASTNQFEVVSEAFSGIDVDGSAYWYSPVLDVSSISVVDFSADLDIIGGGANTAGENITAYYTINPTDVTPTYTQIASYDQTNSSNLPLTISLSALDVSGANTFGIRFEINSNGGGDGYSFDNVSVAESTTTSWLSNATSTDWGSSGNWSNGVPTAGKDVVIVSSTNNPSISSTAECNALTIEVGAVLTIDHSHSLTVNGNLLNDQSNGIVIKSPSSAGPSGSLIIEGTVTGSGTITAERYIAAASWASGNDGFHLISSPVAAEEISGEWTPSGSGNDYDFYGWSEGNQTWVNQKNNDALDPPTWANFHPSTNFNVGQGYLVAYQTAATKTFSGTLNNGDQQVTLTQSGTPAANNSYGYNLIGNPFTSALDWTHESWANENSNYSGVAKIWSGGAFIDLVTADPVGDDVTDIPAMNGFFVYTSTDNNTFTIPAAAQIHSADNWHKSVNNNQAIKLTVKGVNSTLKQGSSVRFNPEATSGFDLAFDSYFMAGYAPMFYSVSEGKNYSTNTLPAYDSETTIPFVFVKNEYNDFELELTNSIEGQPIFLTDNKTGTIHKLSENPVYSFTASEGDNPNRFLLHFGVVGLDENDTESSLRAYTYNNTLYVQNSLEAANLRILDLQGRLLIEKQLNGQGLQSLPLDFPAGVYVVQLLNSNTQKSVKVIVE
jgi:hypothetical protein